MYVIIIMSKKYYLVPCDAMVTTERLSGVAPAHIHKEKTLDAERVMFFSVAGRACFLSFILAEKILLQFAFKKVDIKPPLRIMLPRECITSYVPDYYCSYNMFMLLINLFQLPARACADTPSG